MCWWFCALSACFSYYCESAPRHQVFEIPVTKDIEPETLDAPTTLNAYTDFDTSVGERV